tara:strand:+ start:153 stop:782 length:630 start_codon:yes stop_codon:yes gene_type:complete
MKNKIQLVIFDLDGVLLDTKKNMMISWKEVKKKFGIKLNFNRYFAYVGINFYQILLKLKIKKNLKVYKKIKFTYDSASKKNISCIKLYNGSRNFLKFLKSRGIKICILTSKDFKRSNTFLKKFNIKVDKLLTPEKLKFSKPHPYGINILKRIYKIKNKNTLYFGDTVYDFKSAKNSGVNYIHVNWGYGKKYKSKIRINSFFEAKNYFRF